MNWLGFFIFIIALIGYNSWLRFLGINQYLSWITTILGQIIVLYCFAMFDWLRIGIWTIIGSGCLLFIARIISLFIGKGRLRYEGLHIFDLWMFILGIIMGNILYHSPLIQYDNFSHWAVIVKFLTFTGHLPGTSDAIISFTSYPPAVALFMTEFVSLVGFSDGTMLVAQFILIWAASYTIFAVLRDRTRALTSLILCFTISIANVFNIAIRFNNLLVDYVLPIITVAGIAGLYAYRRQPKLQCLHMASFSATLLLVKNSGAFFVAVLSIYFLYLLFTETTSHGFKHVLLLLGRFTGTLIIAILPFYWWSLHLRIFKVSKHEISAQAYKSQLSSESSRVIERIGHKFIVRLFDLNTLSLQGILLINALLLLTWLTIRYICRKKIRYSKYLA